MLKILNKLKNNSEQTTNYKKKKYFFKCKLYKSKQADQLLILSFLRELDNRVVYGIFSIDHLLLFRSPKITDMLYLYLLIKF